MAARAKGEVVLRDWKSGRGYALRFFAYGRREYLTLGFERDGWTRERAEIELENVIADVRRGIWVPPEKKRAPGAAKSVEAVGPNGGVEIRFGIFAHDLLAARRGQMSEDHSHYLEWGLSHLIPYFADWTLARIDIEAVDAYRAHKVSEAEAIARAAERGKPKRDARGRARRPLSATTINKTIDVLSWVLGYALEYKRIPDNPARGKRRRLTEPQRRPVHLDSAEQIEALLDAAAELDRDRRAHGEGRLAILATLVLGGPRAGELCRLRWRDVDLANGRILIGRSKTQAGLREITLVPILRDILAAHKAAARRSGSEDLVFPTLTGRQRNPDNLRVHVLARALPRADELLEARGQLPLPKGITTHKLRHTFASVLIATGEDPASVMAQLGHTDPKFTLRVYTHLMRRGPGERKRLKKLVAGEREGQRPPLVPVEPLGWQTYEMPILRVLAARGGGARRCEVIAALGEEMAERLGDADHELRCGQPRWKIQVDLSRRHLVRDGWLRGDSGEGIWELSEAGAERAMPPAREPVEADTGEPPGADAEEMRERAVVR